MISITEPKLEEQNCDFISSFIIGKREFVEYSSVIPGRRIFSFVLAHFIFAAYMVWLFSFGPDLFCLICGTITSLIIFFSSIRTQRNIKRSFAAACYYQKAKDSYRKNTCFLPEKFIVSTPKPEVTEYEYAAVTRIMESKGFYFVEMQHYTAVVIMKGIRSCNATESFPDYMLRKCPNLKSRRILRMYDGRVLSGICLTVDVLLLLSYAAMCLAIYIAF